MYGACYLFEIGLWCVMGYDANGGSVFATRCGVCGMFVVGL